MTATGILVAWLLFTASGAAGYLLFRRGRVRPARILLATYSGSGLVGLAHYAAPGIGELAWWRHLHILADVTCGVAMLAFVLWTLRKLGDRPT